MMKYASDDGIEVEWLWNSRDGVVPFVILSHSGKQMSHVDWQLDTRLPPSFVPPPCMRIFAHITREHAVKVARDEVEKAWEADEHGPGLSTGYATKEEAVQYFADLWTDNPEAPMVAEASEVFGIGPTDTKGANDE